MDTRVVRLAVTAMLTVTVFTACEKQQPAPGTAAGGAATKAAAPAAPAAPVADAPWTDARIVAFLDAALTTDSTAGALGATHAAYTVVKNYAKAIPDDHHTLRAQAAKLAPKLGPPEPVGGGELGAALSDVTQKMTFLAPLPQGVAWDSDYLDATMAFEQKVLDLSQQLLDSADQPDLKALIKQMQPVIRQSIDRGAAVKKKEFGK